MTASGEGEGAPRRDPFEPVGVVRVSRRGVRRLRGGHPWVYRSDVEAEPGGVAGFAVLEDDRGRSLGTALYSPRSEIRVRLLAEGSEAPSREWLRARLEAALERRRRLLGDADGFRWVHGEADLLPGIFVDRYGDCLALQTTCAGADLLEPVLVELLLESMAAREGTPARAVVLRDDSLSRDREGLRRHTTLAAGEAPVRASYHEGAVVLEVDLLADQKTGGYLDQSQNHVAAARYVTPGARALDCFTYHGGFALQLAHAGARVTAVDASAAALERARANAARNDLLGQGRLELREANVFDLLPALVEEGERFDLIVLDPPAFASGRNTVEAALRAYKEINRRALRLLRAGGTLISCSCSGRVRPEDFDAVLADAARDARRRVHLLETRTAGPDHPVLVGVPETDYLKYRALSAL